MQLDEQLQQHIVALPIDLKAEVLDFVLFLEQKRKKQATDNLGSKKKHFLELINTIEPVEAPFSSEEMVAMLRNGEEYLIIEARNNAK